MRRKVEKTGIGPRCGSDLLTRGSARSAAGWCAATVVIHSRIEEGWPARNEPEVVEMFDLDLILNVVYWASMVVVVGYVVIAKIFVLWAKANGHMDPAHEEDLRDERRRDDEDLMIEMEEGERDRWWSDSMEARGPDRHSGSTFDRWGDDTFWDEDR